MAVESWRENAPCSSHERDDTADIVWSERRHRFHHVLLGVRQLRAVLRKNFLLKFRRPIATFLEMIFPCVLFGSAAFLFGLRSSYGSGKCYYPSLPFFPLDALPHIGEPMGSLAECEMKSLHGAGPNNCTPPPVDYAEDLLKILDKAVLCNKQGMDDSLRALFDEASPGERFVSWTWSALQQDPQEFHDWMNSSLSNITEVVDGILGDIVAVPDKQRSYFNSRWPAEVIRIGGEVQTELQRVRQWWNFSMAAPNASLPEDLTNESWLTWLYEANWNHTAIGTFIVDTVQWIERLANINFNDYVTGIFGWVTRGWLSFLLKSVGKSQIKKVVNNLHDLTSNITSTLRNLTMDLQTFDAEVPVKIAQAVDDFIWFLTQFLESPAFVNNFVVLEDVLDELDHAFDHIMGKPQASSPSNEGTEPLTGFVHRLILRLQSQSSNILNGLDAFDEKFEELKPDIIDGLAKALTKDFFNALKAADSADVRQLANDYLPWVEWGWRSRCPFRRDWLHPDKIIEIYDWMRDTSIYKAFTGNYDLNVTDFLHEAHTWLQDLDLEWIASAARTIREWVKSNIPSLKTDAMSMASELQVNARQFWWWSQEGSLALQNGTGVSQQLLSNRSAGYEWLVLDKRGVNVYNSKDNESRSGARKAYGDVVIGREEDGWVALSREPGFLPIIFLNRSERVGLPEALGAAIRTEYFRRRGTELPLCENEESPMGDMLADRSVLIAPFRGESRQLVKLVAVELSHSVLTWRNAQPGFWTDLVRWPVMRAGLAFGAYEGLKFVAKSFPDHESLDDYAARFPKKVLAGLVFNADDESGDFPVGPLHVGYELRVHAQLLPQTSKVSRARPFGQNGNTCKPSHPYYERGFTFIQELIGRSVARLQAQRDTGGVTGAVPSDSSNDNFSYFKNAVKNAEAHERVALAYNLDLRMEQAPHQASPDNPAVMAYQRLAPAFYVFSLIPAMALYVKDAVVEKQEKLRELMRIMGLKAWVYWFGQPTFALLQMLVSVAFVLLTYHSFISHSDLSLVFVFFFLYGVATTAFASFVSSFFWRARTAAAVGGLMHFLSALIFGLYLGLEFVASLGVKAFMCLVPTCAGSVGLSTLARWERDFIGARWSNIQESPRWTHGGMHVPSLSIMQICILLLWDSFLYFSLAWYVDKVSPGTFGIPQPWYFPFLPSFWCSVAKTTSIKSAAVEPEDMELPSQGTLEFKQDDLSGLPVAVRVSCVSKVYPNGKHAVHQLRFDMHQSTIVGLLGPNGAGKSTTMAMMTGLYAPTSGDVFVHGISIRRYSEEVRRWLGFCPQHSALYDTLTAEEHLFFFSSLKGVSAPAAWQEVQSMLRSAQLTSRRATIARHLSAGMRRCLSIGCALIGGSNVVVLDEPTAGVDAGARREIWKLLLASKQNRTMLLSTHAMEEAEALCDQIAVINEGRLRSFGSSVALKQHFGNSYTLQVRTTKDAREETITKMFRDVVPSVVFQGSNNSQLCYSLAAGDRNRFPELFDALHTEGTLSKTGISSFMIQDSTLEVVFPESTALREKSLQQSANKSQVPLEKDSPEKAVPVDVPKSASESRCQDWGLCYGLRLMVRQCQSILWMRFLMTKRSKRIFVSTFMLPVCLVVIHLLTIKAAGGIGAEPPLKMHISMFDRLLNPEGGRDEKLFIPCSVELENTSLGTRICDALQEAARDDADVETLDLGAQNSTLGKYIFSNAGDLADRSVGGLSATEAQEADATVTLWFGKRGYHSLPVMMNLWNNARLRLLGLPDTRVEVWSHPLPNTESLLSEEPNHNNEILSSSLLTITILLSTVLLESGLIVGVLHDRVTGSKHQQLVSGVGAFTYWISNFIFDICQIVIPLTLNTLGGLVSGLDAFGGLNALAIFIIYFTFALATAPQMYAAGFFFSNAATAHVSATCINIFVAGITVTTMWIWSMYSWSVEEDFNTEEATISKLAEVMGVVFMVLIPSYCVGKALLDIIINHYKNEAYVQQGICLQKAAGCVQSPFHTSVIGRYVACFLGNSIFWILVVLIIEFGWCTRRKRCTSMSNSSSGDAEEQAQLQHAAGLIFDDVHKSFATGCCRRRRCKAVCGLKASVVAGECFGMIGTNGAGKTTTMKLVTGSIQPSHGDIYVEGMSVSRQRSAVRRNLGFCPQYDSLPELLTAGETLLFYMAVRGLDKKEQQPLRRGVLRKMGLEAHEHTETQNLSGGNRRKLSTAIALLGSPAVVLLDEPTAGIDVHARRMLWSVVQETTQQRCAVLLTSHSMEECEALCTRVSLMASGTLCSPRSPAQVKFEQGERYTLTIEAKVEKAGNNGTLCKATSVGRIRDFVTAQLPIASFSEDIWGILCCQLDAHKSADATGKRAPESLAGIFRTMEEALAPGGPLHGVASDYSISQVSVEDVLLEALSQRHEQSELQCNGRDPANSSEGSTARVHPAVEEASAEVVATRQLDFQTVGTLN